MFRFDEDMHVHSTWSDGKDTLEANLATAEARGLRRLGFVDHVRRDTDWVSDYVAAIEALRPRTRLSLEIGVEAKFLDRSGRLDCPELPPGVDRIYAADHQFPDDDGCKKPSEVLEELASGARGRSQVFRALAEATIGAVEKYPNVVIAHLFSILPKLRLSEDDVPLELIHNMAEAAHANGAEIEIDERWRCPNARTIAVFIEHGVPVRMSTDSHRARNIGIYAFNRQVLETLKSQANVRTA